MEDETLAELLRSPLDERHQPNRWGRFAVPIGVAFAVGLGLGVTWGTSRDSSEPPGSTSPPTITTAVDAPLLPPGYVSIGDGLGVRPLTLYEEGEVTTLVYAAVVEAGRPPEDTTAFAGAAWTLRDGDGATQAAITEVSNPESLGVGAVRFSSATLGDPSAIDIRRYRGAVVIEHSLDVEIAGLPLQSGRTFELPLATDATLLLSVDQLLPDSASVTWELVGGEATGEVDLTITFPETAATDADATRLVSEHIAPPYPFQRPRLPRPTPSLRGSDVLRPAGPQIATPDDVSQAVIDLTVRLYRPAGDSAVTLSLDGVSPTEE